MEPVEVDANPALRYGLSYLSSVSLGPCVGLCTITIMINIGHVIDRKPALDRMLFNCLRFFNIIEPDGTSLHLGTDEIIGLGWAFLFLFGFILEGIKYIFVKYVPISLPSTFRRRLILWSVVLLNSYCYECDHDR